MGKECRDCLRDFEITLRNIMESLCETWKPAEERDIESVRINLETVDTRIGDMKVAGCISPELESHLLKNVRGAYEAADRGDWFALEGFLINLHGDLSGAGLDQIAKFCQRRG